MNAANIQRLISPIIFRFKADLSVICSATVSAESKADPGTELPKPNRLLTLTEAPFLLTAFISLLCWSVTYFSDAVKKSPTIYYKKIDPGDRPCFYLYPDPSQAALSSPNEVRVEYQITNLTRDQVFKDISFYIMATRGSLSEPKAIPIAPAKISDRSPIEPQIQETLARYRLPEFHPGWSFKLRAHLTGGTPKDSRIIFDYSNRTYLNQEVNAEVAPVRLVESSLETYIVEHDFYIIATIFLISFIVIIWYIACGTKNR